MAEGGLGASSAAARCRMDACALSHVDFTLFLERGQPGLQGLGWGLQAGLLQGQADAPGIALGEGATIYVAAVGAGSEAERAGLVSHIARAALAPALSCADAAPSRYCAAGQRTACKRSGNCRTGGLCFDQRC